MSITPKQFAEYTEICKDAITCPRLNAWELSFIDSQRVRLELYGLKTYMSEQQEIVMRRIAKEKIYAT